MVVHVKTTGRGTKNPLTFRYHTVQRSGMVYPLPTRNSSLTLVTTGPKGGGREVRWSIARLPCLEACILVHEVVTDPMITMID